MLMVGLSAAAFQSILPRRDRPWRFRAMTGLQWPPPICRPGRAGKHRTAGLVDRLLRGWQAFITVAPTDSVRLTFPRDRRAPPDATSESPRAPPGASPVAGSAGEGGSSPPPADDLLTIRTRIGFTSVRMSLPEETMKSLGAVSVAVDVAPMTSILP